ncbi:hypothetical protein HNQ40_000991 [Algisphaera agarilytica]|uniref:Glycosyl hydrolase family 13 catalytic domain-containing protein n=1 Tax=Algisphaera agarilytica TaxID=1385975 RepID=A0A7X0H4P7_9BACT|nr:alpha-amylase family glycosyl hydrolase [Algisphaera agarilytica]MBB6429185.1 hypothetical protein [Algisphaera agarilytica]
MIVFSAPLRTARRVVTFSTAALLTAVGLSSTSLAQDASAPAILQYFESRWDTIEDRTIDSFYAGYGGMWVPPPGRADSGGFSVGYDVFDRFDLGSANNETLYGTQRSFKAMTAQSKKAGVAVYADFILNHNGFSDNNRPGFIEAGDYPGFVLELPDDPYGDFHPPIFDGNDVKRFRLSGLIDLDQSKNYQFIRHPVDPNDPRNIPGGTFTDQADPNNARFYTDIDLGGQTVWDPDLNQNVTIYDFNLDNPLAGDAVTENALGLILRNARWMIQEAGVDGFRLDAVKHFDPFVLEFFDQAVHDAAPRNLDGSQRRVFAFSEVFDGDFGLIQSYVQDIDRGDNQVGGNRDALDLPLFFALRNNLTGNGQANDWRNIKNASFDINDDGLANNGSQGVGHVSSHDEPGAELSNVAHAFILMRPGNANVYFNAKQFGEGRDFPKDGRGDALGGQFGDAITTLVDIRNTHGRGNYLDRTPGGDEKEILIYEREKSALVVLSNRVDAGFDSRTVQTSFAPGTYLVELTGNASDNNIDPFDDFPEVLQVKADGTVDLRVLRNVAPDGDRHDSGYLIYGLAGPQGTMSLSNVDSVLAGGTGTTLEENATVRINDVDVITADSFNLTLNTNAVNLLGSIRDRDADGDAAFFKIDGGIDANGNGGVDFVTPNSVLYGFENFTDVNDAGFFNEDGNGTFQQNIDTTQLEEGYHFITTRAFRHRNPGTGGDGGPAVFEDFRRAIYVDRLAPEAQIEALVAFNESGSNLDFQVASVDQTATEMFTFLNLGAAIDDETILGFVEDDPNGSQTTQIDRDLFQRGYFDVQDGHNVLTVVTREITGNTNIQRLIIDIENGNGAGIGDVNKDGVIDSDDLTNSPNNFETFLYSRNALFNPAADTNADGMVDTFDLLGLEMVLSDAGVSQATNDTYQVIKNRRGNLNGNGNVDSFDLLFMRDNRFTADEDLLWNLDINPDGTIDGDDAELFVTAFLGEITGDLTRDGDINLDDANAFVLALEDVNAYQTQYAIDALVTADVNRDWVFDVNDIEAFLGLFDDPSAAAQIFLDAGLPIPEPGTAALLVTVLMGLRRVDRRR